MKCEHVRQLIPEWLGGELDAAENQKIEKHIEACPACRKEKEFWEDVGNVLQDDTAWVSAPEGFAAGITAQLEEEAPAKPGGILAGWKRAAATAAAFLILAAGSLGAYFNWDSITGGQVADNGNNQQVVDQRNPEGDSNLNLPEPAPGEDNSENPDKQQSSNNSPDTPVNNEGTGSSTTSNNEGSGQQSSNQNSGSGSEPSEGNSKPSENQSNSGEATDNESEINSGERVLLNTDRERVIEETLIRVSVADLETAESKAINYIQNTGATHEVITDSQNRKAIKITTENDNLLNRLKTLGEVAEVVEQKDDITSQYNNQVEEYRTLEAQLGNSDNNEIKTKMNSIEAQLERWNNQAKTETIVLWLQK